MTRKEREQLGTKVRKAIIARGMKMTAFAKLVNIKYGVLQNLLHGDEITVRPGLRIFQKLELLGEDVPVKLLPQKMSLYHYLECMKLMEQFAHTYQPMLDGLEELAVQVDSTWNLLPEEQRQANVEELRTIREWQPIADFVAGEYWARLEKLEGITQQDVELVDLSVACSPVILHQGGPEVQVTPTQGGKTFVVHSSPVQQLEAHQIRVARYRWLKKRADNMTPEVQAFIKKAKGGKQ